MEDCKKDMEEAGELIKAGELVAFPTETVYGLGGNGLLPDAAKKIYAATVSYTHLRAHETLPHISYAVFCLKKIFFNDTATTEIYTKTYSSAASYVYKRQLLILT